MFQANVVEKIKTHILCSIHFFYKNRAIYEIEVEKYGTARQAARDSVMPHRKDVLLHAG
jgi:hypothetical protein